MSASLMLLNNTMLNDDANRTGTAQSPVCECGNETETVQHFLLRCPLCREGKKDLYVGLDKGYLCFPEG